MSIFEQPAEQNQAPQETQTQESFVDKLAAERGDNWRDPEVIAKGKLESDNHIKELERQLEEMREDLSKQDYANQLLQQLQNKAPASTADPVVAPNNEGGTTQANTQPEISEDVLKSLVEKTLTDRETANTKQQNIDLVTQQMQEKYGTDAQMVINRKAEELGITAARMEELASESPSAFLTLIGEPGVASPNLTRGSVNTNGLGQASVERDFAYYQKMRRENRSGYYSPKVQQQMMEDRIRLGDRWGS
jgi:hypothetical protein